MRLIDADALKERCDDWYVEGEETIRGHFGEFFVGTFGDLLDAAPTVEPKRGWVSVNDRLPKDGQDVLAYLNDGEETRIAPCNYYNGVWYDSVMNCVVVFQNVTHWMLLPEPPKEGDNAD